MQKTVNYSSKNWEDSKARKFKMKAAVLMKGGEKQQKMEFCKLL